MNGDPHPPTGNAGRLHGLDGLRGSMMLLVAATHVACSHIVGAADWPIVDEPSLSISIIGYLATLFTMNVFLFLGGYFGKAQYDAKGRRSFIVDRTIRIALPLIVFWPVLRLMLYSIYVWADQVVIASGKQPPAHPVNDIATYLMHLWFLYFICLCYIVAIIVRSLPSMPLEWLDRLVAAAGRYRVLALLCALPLNSAILLTTHWQPWIGIPTPAFLPLPNLYALVGYGTAFAAGWIVRRQPEVLDLIANAWLLNMLLAIVATLTNLYLLATVTPTPIKLTIGERLLFGPSYALAAWGWTLGLIGLVLRWVRQRSPIASYIGSASYWVYLMHIPVVCSIQILLYPLDWSPWAKFAVNASVSLAISLLSYNLFVRNSWIGSWLNGRKSPRVAPGIADDRKAVAN